MDDDIDQLQALRHSTAHLLAAAVLELWPDTKNTIGPAIENGFYYDFAFKNPKTQADLPKIEAKMHELLKNWHGFERIAVTLQEAKKYFVKNEFKTELIDEFSKENKQLTFYKSGDFTDLCRGGHIDDSKKLSHFKLTTLAGAYWRGNEKNPMLTRIYGTVWFTDEELETYLKNIEEAKKRDHKKLGLQLELFMFHETAPGMPYWLPNGVILYNELISFWRKEHAIRDYKEIVSPLLNKKDLYVTSGHWDHYLDNMFVSETAEGEIYAAKAMNCPNAMIVFGSKPRSYRELPLRLSDTDTLHRYERSGTLNGLFRVREFRQDDAHIFVTQEQIREEYECVFELVEKFYAIFNLSYSFRLGTRPEKYMGDVETWSKAEANLKEILKASSKQYTIFEGDGAFYGPKIDILMKDSLGRSWQMGTIQLDFQQPRNFKLTYADAEGKEKTPIAIHRVIYGSMERFIGILIEHFGGAFPTWLAPVQVTIVPIADRHVTYANRVGEELQKNNIRFTIDDRSETMQSKIRDATTQKVPYMAIVGDKEEQQDAVAIRSRDGKDLGKMEIMSFVERIVQDISNKSLELLSN